MEEDRGPGRTGLLGLIIAHVRLFQRNPGDKRVAEIVLLARSVMAASASTPAIALGVSSAALRCRTTSRLPLLVGASGLLPSSTAPPRLSFHSLVAFSRRRKSSSGLAKTKEGPPGRKVRFPPLPGRDRRLLTCFFEALFCLDFSSVCALVNLGTTQFNPSEHKKLDLYSTCVTIPKCWKPFRVQID